MIKSALIIDIDEYKKNISGYDPNKPSTVHRQSAKQADQAYKEALKSGKYKRVILMSGGSASGKTEFVHSHLFDENAIIFDSTLSTREGAKVKIRNALRHKLNVEVVLIIPDDLERSYIAFLNRERKLEDKVFFDTHIGSRKTILFLAKSDFDVKIKIVKSTYVNKTMKYKSVSYPDRNTLIEYLESIQVTKKDISNTIGKIK